MHTEGNRLWETSVSPRAFFFACAPLNMLILQRWSPQLNMTSCLPCTSSKCDLFRCQLVLNVFWLHSHLHSQLSTCHIWLSGTVGARTHEYVDSITALVYLHTHVRVHVLHAFRHTSEQRFRAIYRALILAHHICQLLLSKWPRTATALAGKLGGKVDEYMKGPPHNLRECVLVSLWGVREAGSRQSPNRFTEYTCTKSVRGGANNPKEATQTHTKTNACAHMQRTNK